MMGHVFLKICHKVPVYMSWVKTTQSESIQETDTFKTDCRKEEGVILPYIITRVSSGNSMDILLWGYKGNFFGFIFLGGWCWERFNSQTALLQTSAERWQAHFIVLLQAQICLQTM